MDPMSAIETAVTDSLRKSSANFHSLFEQLKRQVPKAYGCLARVAKLHSKKVFDNLATGNLIEAEAQCRFCQKAYDELLALDPPPPPAIDHQVKSDAGQEWGEAAIGIRFFRFLIGETAELAIPAAAELKITEQDWLGAVADAASEMGKIRGGICLYQIKTGKLDLTERELNERYLAFIRGVKEFFYDFAEVPPLVLKASPRFLENFESKAKLTRKNADFAVRDLWSVIRSVYSSDNDRTEITSDDGSDDLKLPSLEAETE